jgi:hypothetical protein
VTSSWKENVFSIFISLTKVKNISFVTQVYNKEPQSVTQKLSVSLMFLNRQVLAPGHNTNIQTILGKDDHTYAKPWTDHELYILLAKPFEIPNLRAKSLNSKLIIVSLTQEATCIFYFQ